MMIRRKRKKKEISPLLHAHAFKNTIVPSGIVCPSNCTGAVVARGIASGSTV